jgi:putative transposase
MRAQATQVDPRIGRPPIWLVILHDLIRLNAAYQAGRLAFFADQAALAEPAAFKNHLADMRKVEWVVYAKRPFAGPDAVLAYLSRYTHRVAIANSRLVAFDGERVTFKWKDYRAKGEACYKVMTRDVGEFIRRFLIHVLPGGFHRIRHYGLFANANRADNIALARRLLGVSDPDPSSGNNNAADRGRQDEEPNVCPCWGGRMIIVRDLRTWLRASALAHPTARARQLMTTTLLPPVHITPPGPGRYPAGNGHASPIATGSAHSHRQNGPRRPDPASGDQRNVAVPAQPAPLLAR